LSTQTYITVAVVSYLLGSIPFGYILVRMFMKQDIRATGSGNIGATNVARSGAKGLAIATLALDALKGSAALLAAATWVLPHFRSDRDVILAFAALCVILGHCFPVWLKFRGGKGVATSLGAFVMLMPKALLIALAVFILVLLLTRYVSLGSILAAIAMPIAAFFFGLKGDALAMLSAACLIVIVKHHQNIKRLLAGTESKFGAAKA
jgi:glycerol-3-phosphate acyltransferase PlsY